MSIMLKVVCLAGAAALAAGSALAQAPLDKDRAARKDLQQDRKDLRKDRAAMGASKSWEFEEDQRKMHREGERLRSVEQELHRDRLERRGTR